MKIFRYITAVSVFLLMLAQLASCGKESPFSPVEKEGEGRLLKHAVSVDLRSDEKIVRAAEGVNMGDFVISIIKDGETEPYSTYKYSEMPDVVPLPAGVYTVKAIYGDNVQSGIDSPYYLGESESFRIVANEITDNIGDIVCRLNNVKVSVEFAPVLTDNMSEDSYVEVRHGKNVNSVNLNKQHELNGNAAYFPYADGEPLSVTFHGTVEGWETHEEKVYPETEVFNGTHYKITFKLHTQDPNNQGGANAGVKVDASVTTYDVERNVPVGEDNLLDDNERPKEDPDKPGPDQPGPDEPGPSGNGPTITAQAPINLESVNVMSGDGSDIVVLNVKSETGIKQFTADIESPNLTPDELAGVGLSSHLDLVNPGELQDALEGLGLPVNVGGQKDVEFNISSFIPLLAIFGPNEHSFILNVTDESGTTTVTLKLKFN